MNFSTNNKESNMNNQQKIFDALNAIVQDFDTTRQLQDFLESSTSLPATETLARFHGIGTRKAKILQAVFELQASYFVGTEARTIKDPEDAMRHLSWLKFEQQEHFSVLTLDSSNHVINCHEISKGLVNQCPVHPREVFRKALEDNAVSVILAHNHPSGCNDPSNEDYAITRTLCAAGKIMQVPVIDHLVVSRTGFISICRRNPSIFESCINH